MKNSLLALGALLLGGILLAAEAPVEIEADGWSADQIKGISIYRGNVVITRGTARITADEARVMMREGRLQAATIIGSPATFRQKPDDAPLIEGRAQRVEYDALKDTAILTGDARIVQGGDEIRAASIFVDLAAEKIVAKSDRQTPERVRITLTPRKDTADGEQ